MGAPIVPSFNPKACKIIDEFGKKHGYTFQHAMNGGEVTLGGYFVDGYDKENNVVIEYYEPFHKKQRNSIYDKNRKR
jgi:hypothetical protein